MRNANRDNLFCPGELAGMQRSFNPRMPALPLGSERAQEIQQVLHLRWSKRIVFADYQISFGSIAAVRLNGLDQICGPAIVKKEQPLSQSPQWRRSELIATSRALVNAVRQSRSQVMQGKIGVRGVAHLGHAGRD